nr:ribosomal protein L16 [Thismia panamensis]
MRYKKSFLGKLKKQKFRRGNTNYGKYALQALEPAMLTSGQIEAGRRTIIRNIRHSVKVIVCILADRPITKKHSEARMGSGKGSIKYYVSLIKYGQVLYELKGNISSLKAKTILLRASYKLPIRTRFFFYSN